MRILPTIKIKCLNKGMLYIQVTLPGTKEQRISKNLGIKINPDHWDSKNEKVTKLQRDYTEINKTISDEKYNLTVAFEQEHRSKTPFTVVNIRRRLAGAANDGADFYSFAQSHIRDSNYSKESVRTYLSEISKMQQHSPALSFAGINYKWLQGYEKWMRSGSKNREPNHPNTVWKSFKFINTIINSAIKQDIIKENPFKHYNRGKYKQGIPVYLEWAEAQLFHKAIISKTMTEYQRLQGYYALLSYYSGLRFGDAVNFNYDTKVIEDTNGKRLILYAAKNGEIVSIAFTRYIDEVVSYIKERPIKISNQEFNETIKIIAGIAEIKKTDLSSHSFRHGFAMRCAELGMSIDEVQRLLGHNKRSTTEIYFRIKDRRLDSAMSKW